MFKKITILYKENDAVALKTAEEIKNWLHSREIDCAVFHSIGAESNLTNKTISAIQDCDTVMVLGGDGTILSASRIIGGKKIPIIGINMGTLGFITEFSRNNLFESLKEIFSGNYKIEERSMLKTEVFRDDKIVSQYLGLNDLVIGKGIMAKIADFDLIINNVYVATIKADGIIISTPTGSTAYNLSAGGPILYPTLKELIFTPVCPHTLSVRPLVLPDNFIIDIAILSSAKDIFLTIDGQVCFPLKTSDKVRCRVAEEKTYLVVPKEKDYFRVLREKLRWGER